MSQMTHEMPDVQADNDVIPAMEHLAHGLAAAISVDVDNLRRLDAGVALASDQSSGHVAESSSFRCSEYTRDDLAVLVAFVSGPLSTGLPSPLAFW